MVLARADLGVREERPHGTRGRGSRKAVQEFRRSRAARRRGSPDGGEMERASTYGRRRKARTGGERRAGGEKPVPGSERPLQVYARPTGYRSGVRGGDQRTRRAAGRGDTPSGQPIGSPGAAYRCRLKSHRILFNSSWRGSTHREGRRRRARSRSEFAYLDVQPGRTSASGRSVLCRRRCERAAEAPVFTAPAAAVRPRS